MRKIPATGPLTLGIDTSHYDGTIDWAKVQASGVKFAFMKATEGRSFKDKTYDINRALAKQVGILTGAYHFYRPNRPAIQQADFFCSVIGSCDGELPPVMDWETTDNVPVKDDVIAGMEFLIRVEEKLGRTPIIYTSPYFAEALRLHSGFEKYPLWIAHYGTKAPLVPYPWKNWTFWQQTDRGSIAGIPAQDEDVNVFNGTFEQLKALVL